jgi:hypothetical protein
MEVVVAGPKVAPRSANSCKQHGNEQNRRGRGAFWIQDVACPGEGPTIPFLGIPLGTRLQCTPFLET